MLCTYNNSDSSISRMYVSLECFSFFWIYSMLLLVYCVAHSYSFLRDSDYTHYHNVCIDTNGLYKVLSLLWNHFCVCTSVLNRVLDWVWTMHEMRLRCLMLDVGKTQYTAVKQFLWCKNITDFYIVNSWEEKSRPAKSSLTVSTPSRNMKLDVSRK